MGLVKQPEHYDVIVTKPAKSRKESSTFVPQAASLGLL